MVDEADIDLVGGGSAQGARGVKRPAESPSPSPSRPSKRKAGPLPRDVFVRRPSIASPSPTPPSSSTPVVPPSPQPTPDVAVKQENVSEGIPSYTIPLNAKPVDIVDDEPDHLDNLVIDCENQNSPGPRLAVVNNDSKPSKLPPQNEKTTTVLNHEECTEVVRKKVEDTDVTVRVNGDATGSNFKFDSQSLRYLELYLLGFEVNASSELLFVKQSKVLVPKAVVQNTIDVQEAHKHNLEIRSNAYKAVRRPGKSNVFFIILIYILTSADF